jgi:ABC-type bacteriocin/lantibiotic exporter with double-glycine peptidase domain
MQEYTKLLNKITFLSVLSKLLVLPIGIVFLRLMPVIVSAATKLNLSAVLRNSAILVASTVLVYFVSVVVSYLFERHNVRIAQYARLSFIKKYLSNPLILFNDIMKGDVVENLNDDISMDLNRMRNIIPDLIVSFITILLYLTLIAIRAPSIAIIFVLLSVLYVIPPLLTRKIFSKNYSNNRDIESKITEHYLEGYKGIETIKTNNLASWYIAKLKELHKIYFKIGNISEITAIAESSMNKLVSMLTSFGSYVVVGLAILNKTINIETGVGIITLSVLFLKLLKQG